MRTRATDDVISPRNHRVAAGGSIIAAIAFVTGYATMGSGSVMRLAVGSVFIGGPGLAAFVTGVTVGRRRSEDGNDFGCC